MSKVPRPILLRAALLLAVCLLVMHVYKISANPDPAAARSTQQYIWRNAEIVGGGFVPGIIFNRTEPNLIYARTDIGGAYRWNPGTNRWIPLLDFVGFDDWNLMGVDSLATDPVDPNRLYVLAGTYTNVPEHPL